MKLQRHHTERDAHRLEQADEGSPAPPDVGDEPMKCVWSGYPDYNRNCRSRIPASVVIKAWHREIQLKGTVEGFYYFSWRSGVWLAYGLRDGRVRGVYCPTHCVDRDSRETQGEDSTAETPKNPPVQRAVATDEGRLVRAARLGVALR